MHIFPVLGRLSESGLMGIASPFFQSLEKKRAVLREVQDNLAKLQEKFEENTRKKEDLERQVICNKYKAHTIFNYLLQGGNVMKL